MSQPSLHSSLSGKIVLVTGGARRVGRLISLAAASLGATVIIHHSHSPEAAEAVKVEIQALGSEAFILTADFSQPESAVDLVHRAFHIGRIYAVVNNSAVFQSIKLPDTTLESWQEHLNINLTAPFLISREFSSLLTADEMGKIINILDWRAFRPGADHFPYTISKAGLAALTQSLAISLAPRISVNGLAFGAILPPANEKISQAIIESVPMQRWAKPEEVEATIQFLLTAPPYITGEILHLDGGRQLV
jgi:pteridine reductase